MSRPAKYTREFFVAQGRKGGLAGDPDKKAIAGATKTARKSAAAKRNLAKARRIRSKLAKMARKEASKAALAELKS